MNAGLLEYEIQDVMSSYPEAERYETTINGVGTVAWYINMNPIPDSDIVPAILADLEAGGMVSIGLQGKIFHSTKCDIPDTNHTAILSNIRLEQQPYLVDLIYRPPVKKSTWSAQPMVKIISPEISARTYPYHPHMYVGNGSWACPLSPQDKGWKWEKGATIAYLDQVAIWLLKTAVWIKTGAGVAGFGKWIGPDTSHKPLSLIATIGADDPCWCGNGLQYRECHRQSDITNAVRTKR